METTKHNELLDLDSTAVMKDYNFSVLLSMILSLLLFFYRFALSHDDKDYKLT